MAKKSKKRAAPKEMTRKQRSRLLKEQQFERIIVWSVVGVAIVVIGLLAYGFIVENVIKGRQPVAEVGDTSITTAEFQARVRFSRMQLGSELIYLRDQQAQLNPTDPEVEFLLEYIQNNIRELEGQLVPENALIIGDQSLEQLIQEELIRQEAQRRDIVVPEEEVNVAIEQFFGYDRNPVLPTLSPTLTRPLTPTDVIIAEPTATPLPTPTPMTEAAYQQRYDNFVQTLRGLDIPEQMYRSWVKASLLLEAVRESMFEESATVADQVKIRYVTIDDQAQAEEVEARWRAGEDYDGLLEELQASEEFSAYGSELEWLPREALEFRFDAAAVDQAFSLGVGELSGPIARESGTQFTIIEVLGHEEQPLDEYLRQQVADEAFQAWLEAQEVLVERGSYRDRVPTDP